MSISGCNPAEQPEAWAFAPTGVGTVATSHPRGLRGAGDDGQDYVEAEGSEHGVGKFRRHAAKRMAPEVPLGPFGRGPRAVTAEPLDDFAGIATPRRVEGRQVVVPDPVDVRTTSLQVLRGGDLSAVTRAPEC